MTTRERARTPVLDFLTAVFTAAAVLAVVALLFPGARLQVQPQPETYPYVGDGWTALSVDEDGHPVAWSSCGTIYWAYDPTGGPEGGLALVSEAFRRMGDLTGLTFEYTGEHAVEPALGGPRADSQGRPLPVRVSWRDSDHSMLDDNYVGLAWPIFNAPAEGEQLRYVSGVIILNREYLHERPMEFERRTDFGTVVMHEIAHVLGLGHSYESSGLMSRGAEPESRPVEDQDIAGLRALYPGCVNS